jgi:hypothetical protein
MKDLFPKPSRPLEYVAFINLKAPTLEGPAYIFMGCDGYSEFAFNICVEPDESDDSVLKAVYLLTENKDFVKHIHNGFTLVFDRFEELSERIERVVKPVGGKILFNKELNQKIAAPVIESFAQFLKKGREG